jgi:hypothetical protein
MTQPRDIEPYASATALLRRQSMIRTDRRRFCSLTEARLDACNADAQSIRERAA